MKNLTIKEEIRVSKLNKEKLYLTGFIVLLVVVLGYGGFKAYQKNNEKLIGKTRIDVLNTIIDLTKTCQPVNIAAKENIQIADLACLKETTATIPTPTPAPISTPVIEVENLEE